MTRRRFATSNTDPVAGGMAVLSVQYELVSTECIEVLSRAEHRLAAWIKPQIKYHLSKIGSPAVRRESSIVSMIAGNERMAVRRAIQVRKNPCRARPRADEIGSLPSDDPVHIFKYKIAIPWDLL